MTTNPTFDKFREKFNLSNEFLSQRNLETLRERYRDLRQRIGKMKTFTIRIENLNNLIPFVAAVENELPKLNKDLTLTVTDKDGNKHYELINKNTLNLLADMFDEHVDAADSEGTLFRGYNNISTIQIEFVDRKLGGKRAGGYFPYWNLSRFDLSRYGIYSSAKHPCINESCLVTAFDESEILTVDEFTMLRSFVKTRHVLKEDIKKIAELLKIDIKLAHRGIKKELKDFHYDTHVLHWTGEDIKSYNVKEFEALKSSNRLICLTLFSIFQEFEHYVLTDPLEQEIIVEYFGEGKKANLTMVLIEMFKRDLFKPMTEEIRNQLDYSYKIRNGNYNMSRPIVIPRRVYNSAISNKLVRGKRLFGFDTSEYCIEILLNNLQKIVDRIVPDLNVRCYTKYSDLIQRIMFEYGCFENVLESCGDRNKAVRDSIVFPKTRTFNDKSLYLSGKYYYLDMNGAYLSFMNGIPYNLDEDCERNYKINDLISLMFSIRNELKAAGNPLEKTLKFMMTSSYGCSIRKQKVIKTKFSDNVDKALEDYGQFASGYSYRNGKKGFISKVKGFCPHFNYPQLTSLIMKNYHEFMGKVEQIVDIKFRNVDAILVNESDYLKLKELGYVGSELGKFKIEKVFKEIAILSPKKRMGILEDGSLYKCPQDLNIDYEPFKRNVIEKM